MPDIVLDAETKSAVSLSASGTWRYAEDAATDLLCLCFAVDDDSVETCLPGDPVPAAFLAAAADPQNWRVISHGEFDRAIYERVLVPRYGFPALPVAVFHCSMALALANGYPAELDLLAQVLGLDYQKDRDGGRLMRQMSRPRKPRKGEDKTILHWVFDVEKLARLVVYCKQDVRTARAIWRHPRLRHLSPAERQLQVLDAIINRRGVRADRELTQTARKLALEERNRINAALHDLTDGAIHSVDQVARIRDAVVAHGHDMTALTKRSVSAVLAGEPDKAVRQLLELRRDGARVSTRKYERILSSMSAADDRMRGTMRMYGAGPGRWSGRGAQLQNLKKNENNLPLAAIDAVRSGNREQLRAYGNPLDVLADIARAVICASSGKVLMTGDFSAIESRVLAWLTDETWKLDAYRNFDATGDKAREPYRLIAAQMLQKPAETINTAERQLGKAGELACGFGGSVGAWRRIASDDKRTDEEIKADVYAWRRAHSRTTTFWQALARAIRVAIRTGQPMIAGKIVAAFEGGNLTLTLPSGRLITYPEARLVPSKFEDAPPDVLFKDNAHGKWSDYRGWFGTFVENVVQGTARDLLAAALLRFETRGIPVVLHVHDEVVAEIEPGSLSEPEFLAILLAPPDWATGLPLAGSVWTGAHYFEPPEDLPPALTTSTISTTDAHVTHESAVEAAIDATLDIIPEDFASPVEEEPTTNELVEDTEAPLFDLVSVPLTADRKTTCPFHPDDRLPSLQFYADHFHCFGCGEHGDRLDWLMRGEDMTREEAIATIKDWDRPVQRPIDDKAAKLARALTLWEEAGSIRGTLAERYLVVERKIELSALPADLDKVLRFHPHCPFGQSLRHPCLLALLRNPTTDAPTGIQRIALTSAAKKIDRRMLGQLGAVKPWSAGSQLVIGEGIETVLAAATRIPYHGAPLQPAWSALSTGLLENFPVLPGVERLIILVDHDFAGKGAAAICAERWTRAGRTVIRLTPKRAGADFNDLVKPEPVS
jgi:DNA polymerase